MRDFARATGKLAKTDRLDAEVLARFGEAIRPEARLLADEQAQALEALVTRPRQLVEMLTAEKNRRARLQRVLHRERDELLPVLVWHPATEGKCLDVLWSTDQGRYGSVNLTGLAVVLAMYAPGPKFDDGNWRVAIYGEERATSEQRDASETAFSGEQGAFSGTGVS